MSQNYLAPAFKVEINGSRLKADVSKNITQISVTNEPDTLDHFNLTIANPYPAMRWTHTQDANIFKEGNSISIELGYVDNLKTMFDGEITSISPTFPESGTPTVAVQGYSRLRWLKGSPKTRTFKEMTDQKIVETIAREAGLTARAENTAAIHEYVIQHNQTDLDFLMDRAGRLRFELLVEGKTLIFRKAEDDRSKTYSLVWGRTLKSFSPRMNILAPVDEVVVTGYDPRTKKTISGRAGSGDEDTKMGGQKTGAQIAKRALGKPRKETIVDQPVATQAEADQLARTIYNERMQGFITGSGSSVGIPDLKAGQVIELDRLGDRFSGLYYITSATHSISSGGYRTSFNVRRNSSNEK